MATSCAAQCVSGIAPSSTTDCRINIRKGGMPYFVVATCDITAELLADGVDPVTNEAVPDVWLPYLQACKIKLSPLQAEGGLETAGTNEQSISACLLPFATQATHTFTFRQIQRTVSELDANFYRYVVANQLYLRVGVISCYEEKFYPFMPFNILATSPHENTVNGLWTINSTITVLTDLADSILPVVKVKGLASMLANWSAYDCNSGGYASDSEETYAEELFLDI